MNNVFFGLRKVQKETYDACIEKKYGIVSDTCGSGKSNIEFELICNSIINNLGSKAFIVLAAHRLDLIDQHIDNFKNYIEDYHPELVDSYGMFEISSANRKDKKIVSTTCKDIIQNYVIGV